MLVRFWCFKSMWVGTWNIRTQNFPRFKAYQILSERFTKKSKRQNARRRETWICTFTFTFTTEDDGERMVFEEELGGYCAILEREGESLWVNVSPVPENPESLVTMRLDWEDIFPFGWYDPFTDDWLLQVNINTWEDDSNVHLKVMIMLGSNFTFLRADVTEASNIQ